MSDFLIHSTLQGHQLKDIDLDGAGPITPRFNSACDQSARSQIARLCVLSMAGWHQWLGVLSSSVGITVVITLL